MMLICLHSNVCYADTCTNTFINHILLDHLIMFIFVYINAIIYITLSSAFIIYILNCVDLNLANNMSTLFKIFPLDLLYTNQRYLLLSTCKVHLVSLKVYTIYAISDIEPLVTIINTQKKNGLAFFIVCVSPQFYISRFFRKQAMKKS